MDLTTALIQLSGILQQKHTLQTITGILSSLRELSGIPIHPYDRLKYDLFGKDFSFPTLNDLKVPENFCPYNSLCQLTAITEKTNQIGMSALSSLQDATSPGLFETSYVMDQDFLKRNLEFVEIVKTVTLADIQTRPIETMQKLTSFYINNCK